MQPQHPQSSADLLGPELDDLITQNVELAGQLHARAEREVSRYQRAIEVATRFLGRPLFLYLILAFVVLWVTVNLLAIPLHRSPFDPPPFYWLQGMVGLGALLMTTVVLITQNRLSQVEQERAQLDLQVNLLAEQKIAKLISLVEELRRDMPNVRDRTDSEALAMSESADPHAVLSALEETLERVEEEVQELKGQEGGGIQV
jgi:uncharacterized membrane protein